MDHPNREHVRLALTWLLHAQTRKADGGIPKAFHLLYGWLPSYPETSGYWIPTLQAAADAHPDLPLAEAARRIADWLLAVQQEDGAFPDSGLEQPLVFDTGQILLGLVSVFDWTGTQRYLDAAVRAGEFLLRCQEDDGSWVRHAFHAIPHVYYTRVAWGLMRLSTATGERSYRDRARANVEWALRKQRDNGFFDHAGFTVEGSAAPFTHTIAYALEGIVRIGIQLDEKDYLGAVRRGLEPIVAATPDTGRIPGSFDAAWRGDASYSCLTGCAQLALVARLLHGASPDPSLESFARRVNAYLRTRQRIRLAPRWVRGALAGSTPIWKDYHRLSYPNWAAKFLVDSLLVEDGCPAPTG